MFTSILENASTYKKKEEPPKLYMRNDNNATIFGTMFESVRFPVADQDPNMPDKDGIIPNIEKAFADDPIGKAVCYMVANSHEYKNKPNVEAGITFAKNYSWKETTMRLDKMEGINKPVIKEKVLDMANSIKESGEKKPLVVCDKLHGVYPQSKGCKILFDGHHRKEALTFIGDKYAPVYSGTYTGNAEKAVEELIGSDDAITEAFGRGDKSEAHYEALYLSISKKVDKMSNDVLLHKCIDIIKSDTYYHKIVNDRATLDKARKDDDYYYEYEFFKSAKNKGKSYVSPYEYITVGGILILYEKAPEGKSDSFRFVYITSSGDKRIGYCNLKGRVTEHMYQESTNVITEGALFTTKNGQDKILTNISKIEELFSTYFRIMDDFVQLTTKYHNDISRPCRGSKYDAYIDIANKYEENVNKHKSDIYSKEVRSLAKAISKLGWNKVLNNADYKSSDITPKVAELVKKCYPDGEYGTKIRSYADTFGRLYIKFHTISEEWFEKKVPYKDFELIKYFERAMKIFDEGIFMDLKFTDVILEKCNKGKIRELIPNSTDEKNFSNYVESASSDGNITESTSDEYVSLTPEEAAAVKEKYGDVECSFFKRVKNGKYFCKTHRACSSDYDSPTDIPKNDVAFVSSTS